MPSRDDEGPEPDPGAEVIPLRAQDAGSVTAFDEGRPDGAVYLDVTGTGGKRRDIIPEHLQRGRIGGTLGEWSGRAWFQFRFHGIRLPFVYVPWFTWLAMRGTGILAGRLASWWGASGLWVLESQAVARGPAGHHEAMNAHKEGKKTRGQRARIVGVCAVVILVLLLAGWHYFRWWAIGPLAAVTFPVLIWHGRPEDRPIIKPALMPAEFTVPTPEVITRALCAIGIEKINAYVKEHGTLEWVSDVHRDGDGWGVDLNLPHGVTAKMIIERRARLASGLRRPLSAVWPEAVPDEHEGRLFLWIGRHDLAKVRPPAYPLLRAGACDVFQPVPFATIPRGTAITVPMFETNWLIGAAPGNGKTAAVRDLGCDAALDIACDLWVHELAGKGDLAAFEQVAHRYVSGLDDEAIEYSAVSAAKLRSELKRRSDIFKKIPRERRPDGKLTRELALADHRLRPIVAIWDECFPAGTLVGSRPINGLRIGDLVPSWDEATGLPCTGIVTRLFRSQPSSLVRIRWADGSSLTCTPGHPFMTSRGWQQAAALDATSEVLAYGQEDAADHRPLLDLRDGVHARVSAAGVLEEDGPGNLLTAMPQGGQAPRWDKGGILEDCRWARLGIAAHEGAQPDGGSSGESEGCGGVAGWRPSAEGARGQWARAYRAAAAALGGARLAYRGDRAHRPRQPQARVAYALQAGYRGTGLDDRGGSGRRIAQFAGTPGTGPAQGRVAHWQRVDRVEVLEPGSDGRYGGLCPDGYVYNVEVAGTHTYLVAGGLVVHNCQNMFLHPEYGGDAAEDLPYVMRLGRAYGIIVILATQRPDKDSLPTQISSLVQARFCLKVGEYLANDMILGTGAYKAGYSAVEFRQSVDAGLGWLRGTGDAQPVKTYYMDLNATAKVCARARAMRQQAGVLSGYALGEGDEQPARDVLADVLSVFAPGETGLHWQPLADRLEVRYPERWTGATAESVSAECRDAGVPSVVVKSAGAVLRGCRRADVEAAAVAS